LGTKCPFIENEKNLILSGGLQYQANLTTDFELARIAMSHNPKKWKEQSEKNDRLRKKRAQLQLDARAASSARAASAVGSSNAFAAFAAWRKPTEGAMTSPSRLEELERLEAQEKLLDSEVRSLRDEVEKIAEAAMKTETGVLREEKRVSRMEECSYKEADDLLHMLRQGNDHGWDNTRSWIGWETCGWFPNYY
jgi:hypothetical protein